MTAETESPARVVTIAPASRLLHVALAGSIGFGLIGLVEAGLIVWGRADPEPAALVGRNVLAMLALGLVAGTVWGMLCEALGLRRAGRSRRRLHLGALFVIGATLVGVLDGQLHALGAGLRTGGTSSLLLAGGTALAGLVAWLAVLAWSRRGDPDEPLFVRPARAVLAFAMLGGVGITLPRLDSVGGEGDGPNVLLVVLDTTRFDRLDPYGYGRDTTPALARLAEQGVVFERAYSASPWTLPSHASLFTGRLPTEHGATSEFPLLRDGHRTLAEDLGERGRHTLAVHKKGWLHRETGVLAGFDQVYDLLDPLPGPGLLELWRRVRPEPDDGDQGAAAINRTVDAWLDRHGEVPFFLFVNYDEAHSPLEPDDALRSRFLGERAASEWGRGRQPHAQRFNTGLESYEPPDFEVFSDLYDADIAYQDSRLSELIGQLQSRGLLDDTIVIVTADHGENLGEHGLLGHDFSLYDTVLRVPLVLRWPARLPAGLTVAAPVETRRLGTLLRALLDAPPAAPLDAPPAEPLADSPAALAFDADALAGLMVERPDGAILSELYRPPFGTPAWKDYPALERFDRRLKSVIVDGHKFVWGQDGRDALYNLAADPREQHDLFAEQPARAGELRALLLGDARLWNEAGPGDMPELSEELRRHLAEQGYLR